jgi:hypothetical protein
MDGWEENGMPWIDSSNGPHPAHPIVAAALALSGHTPEMVTGNPAWKGGQSQSFGGGGPDTVRVTCQRQHVTVHMPGPDDQIVFYINEDMADPRHSFWIHQLEFRNWMPPETVLGALAGRTVDTVAEIPGASGLVIVEAVEMARGLVLTLAPPGMTARTAEAKGRSRIAA